LKEIDATTQVVSDDGLQFIQHNQPRSRGEFALDWTPPSTDVGEIMVFVAANASVAGQRNARIHFRSFALRPAVRDTVVNAAGLSGDISSGAWASVLGSNLAKTTRSWNSAEFHNGRLPTSLDGVTVTVNGRAAAMSYVSPSQINFQTPDDETLGPAAVEARLDDRVAGVWRTNRRAAAPGLFSVASGGREYAAAVHADGSLITGTKPAQPGEAILVFANGLGPTDPPVPSGHVFSGAARLVHPPVVSIGLTSARVDFAGLVGAGLYQVNVIVPELAPGDHEIKLIVNGQSTQSRIYLAITK
jgi:uncharacterized protein (TIGR03437 family)